MSTFEHRASGRTARTAAILLAVWLAVLWLWQAVDMAPLIALLLLLPTLPAALDFARDRRAVLCLSERDLHWRSGRSSGEVALARLDHVRLETRLDLSVRVRLVLDSGKRLTLPQDCVPPLPALQAALEARGIAHQRHHFSLLS